VSVHPCRHGGAATSAKTFIKNAFEMLLLLSLVKVGMSIMELNFSYGFVAPAS
jgi:hypothetical protein